MDCVKTRIEDHTCIISLSRPKVLNALNSQLMAELAAAIALAKENDEVKGIIITGEGEKAFAAGADIAEFKSLSKKDASKLSQKGQQIFREIESAQKPIIGAINGFALGGGCELAMACHMRLAADHASFGQPEVKLGLIAAYGGTQRLSRHIGQSKATELLITGEMINAEQAFQLGLVNKICPLEELIPNCQKILQKAYRNSPKAIAHTLEAVLAAFEANNGFEVEQEAFGECMVSEDAKEGISAFLEKRTPRFTGK